MKDHFEGRAISISFLEAKVNVNNENMEHAVDHIESHTFERGAGISEKSDPHQNRLNASKKLYGSQKDHL